MNDKCELEGKLDKSEWKVVDIDSIKRLKEIEMLIEEKFKILQEYVHLMGKYVQADYENRLKAEREKMIFDDNMYYLNIYLNERNIILRTITGERETLESLCSTCNQSCPNKLKQNFCVLDKIRAEVENINVWGMRYNSDTDKNRKPQIVQKVKEHVIEIIDNYKAESEG